MMLPDIFPVWECRVVAAWLYGNTSAGHDSLKAAGWALIGYGLSRPPQKKPSRRLNPDIVQGYLESACRYGGDKSDEHINNLPWSDIVVFLSPFLARWSKGNFSRPTMPLVTT